MQGFWSSRVLAAFSLTWIALFVACSARSFKETGFAGLNDEAGEAAGLGSLRRLHSWFALDNHPGFRVQEQGASRPFMRRLLVPGNGGANSNGANVSTQQQPSNAPTAYSQGILVSPFISVIMGAAICMGLCIFLSVCRVVVRHRFAEPLMFEATLRQDAPSSGLPFSVLKALSVVSFKKESESETLNQGSGDNQCPICLIEFEEKDKLRKLPECSHYFHQTCVDEWFKRNHTCPLCRISLLPHEEVAPPPSTNASAVEFAPVPINTTAALEQEPGQAVPPLAPMEREGPEPPSNNVRNDLV